MLQKKNISFLFFLMVLCIFGPLVSGQAADKVVVIPLFGHGKPLKNIVTVAKAGGKFTDPVAAVNSITDASSTNPYLVVIAPGVYTLTHTLIMKPWVDVMGSGENVTKLTGGISDSVMWNSAIVYLQNDTVLSNLTIENVGGNKYSIGVFSEGGSSLKPAKIWKVSVDSTGGIYNSSIMVYFSSAIITDVNASCQGGLTNEAISILHSSAIINRVYASASGNSSQRNSGVVSGYSNTELNDVRVSADDGIENDGLYNYYTTVQMTQVQAIGKGGTKNYGMSNIMGGCYLNIRRSTVIGETYGVYDSNPDSGKTFFSQSTISGGTRVTGSGILSCVACDDGRGNALDGSCQ